MNCIELNSVIALGMGCLGIGVTIGLNLCNKTRPKITKEINLTHRELIECNPLKKLNKSDEVFFSQKSPTYAKVIFYKGKQTKIFCPYKKDKLCSLTGEKCELLI